jgi:farnesyl-diphosphate farnesyltransferase
VTRPPLTHGEIAVHLTETSRTFALTIPLLGAPLEAQIGAAYLLFRVADTLEDAPRWGRAPREQALLSFSAWVRDPSAPEATAWLRACEASQPTHDAGCLALLADADRLHATVSAFPGAVRDAMIRHVVRTADGMARFVSTQGDSGELELPDIDALAAYCYVVAGIVGELLTELFVIAEPALASVESALGADARAFGEGLQLVNILKDARDDAQEGRRYLPRSVPRADVTLRARRDLETAARYVDTLTRGGASAGVLAFTGLPVALAVATLDRLDAGATKLTREEVGAIAAPFLASLSPSRSDAT